MIISLIIFPKPLDKITLLCYTIYARCERDWFADYLSRSIQTYHFQKLWEKSKTFFPKPLDKHRILCYNQSVNKREGWLFRTEFLRVVSFPIWRLVYIPPFERRLVVLPVGFHGGFLSDDGERPVTARKMRLAMWKEYTHISWRDSSMTVDRHWQLGNRRAADIVDWDNRSPSVFETGSAGAAPTSTARLIFENRNVIILRGNSIG